MSLRKNIFISIQNIIVLAIPSYSDHEDCQRDLSNLTSFKFTLRFDFINLFLSELWPLVLNVINVTLKLFVRECIYMFGIKQIEPFSQTKTSVPKAIQLSMPIKTVLLAFSMGLVHLLTHHDMRTHISIYSMFACSKYINYLNSNFMLKHLNYFLHIDQ